MMSLSCTLTEDAVINDPLFARWGCRCTVERYAYDLTTNEGTKRYRHLRFSLSPFQSKVSHSVNEREVNPASTYPPATNMK